MYVFVCSVLCSGRTVGASGFDFSLSFLATFSRDERNIPRHASPLLPYPSFGSTDGTRRLHQRKCKLIENIFKCLPNSTLFV